MLKTLVPTLFVMLVFGLFLPNSLNGSLAHNAKDLDYYPLPAGAQWEYKGRAGFGTNITNARIIRSVDGQILINGKTYAKLKTSSNSPKSPGDLFEFYRIGKEGLYLIENEKPSTNEYLFLPIPIPRQTSWRLNNRSEARAERINEIEVNKKKYTDCLKITVSKNENGDLLTVSYYLAKGIGLIKVDSKGQVMGRDLSIEMELESYKLSN